MENNFYVGVVNYGRRFFRKKHTETMVLYSDDNVFYLDLLTGRYYTTNESDKIFVDEMTLVPTDITQYREDYIYLLSKNRDNKTKKRQFNLKG